VSSFLAAGTSENGDADSNTAADYRGGPAGRGQLPPALGRRLAYSGGFTITRRIQDAIGKIPRRRGLPATTSGTARAGADGQDGPSRVGSFSGASGVPEAARERQRRRTVRRR